MPPNIRLRTSSHASTPAKKLQEIEIASFDKISTSPSDDNDPTQWKVKQINVVCHSEGEIGRRSVRPSHWSIYLLADEGAWRLNMEAGDSVNGCLKIVQVNEKVTELHAYIKHWTFTMKKAGVTIHDFVGKVVMENNRHLYTMAEPGAGCRYWVYCVLSDFKETGWIDFNEDGANFEGGKAMNFKYFPTAAREESEMACGTFHGKQITNPETCGCGLLLADCAYIRSQPYGPVP